jgi:uncharacterized membrane protein
VGLNWRTPNRQFILAIVVSSLVSESLFAYGVIRNHSLEFSYLSWNLVLAWLPLLFSIRLNKVLHRKLWSSWEALALSALWLIFLPNSFYMISDFIHIQDVSQANLIYDTVMLTSFIYTGVTLGFSSLFLIHLQLRRRFSTTASALWAAVMLLICSIAIYFGRDLRWSSWNVLTNPGGLLFDITYRLQHLSSYPEMIVTVISFFVLLATIYNLLWKGVHLFVVRRVKSQTP